MCTYHGHNRIVYQIHHFSIDKIFQVQRGNRNPITSYNNHIKEIPALAKNARTHPTKDYTITQ